MNEQSFIELKGLRRPCYVTGGAMMAFKSKFGKEIDQANLADSTEAMSVLFFCTRSACRREGVPFDWDDVESFADEIVPMELMRALSGISATGEEKKSKDKPSRNRKG